MFDPSVRPEVIGHRGAPRERIENTLPAFARALALGADAVELDVHATHDGVIIVHHDDTPRALDGDGRPERRSFAELAAAEVAALRFADGSHVPTLDELLDLIGVRAVAYVEIKGRGIERAVIATLERHRTATAVHSFDHRAVRRVSTARPELRCGILLSSYVLDPAALLRGAGALDLWQEWHWIDEPLVRAVHGAGARVIAWTANEPHDVHALAGLGVDAVCTDLPGVVRDLLGPPDRRAPRRDAPPAA